MQCLQGARGRYRSFNAQQRLFVTEKVGEMLFHNLLQFGWASVGIFQRVVDSDALRKLIFYAHH